MARNCLRLAIVLCADGSAARPGSDPVMARPKLFEMNVLPVSPTGSGFCEEAVDYREDTPREPGKSLRWNILHITLRGSIAWAENVAKLMIPRIFLGGEGGTSAPLNAITERKFPAESDAQSYRSKTICFRSQPRSSLSNLRLASTIWCKPQM